MEALLESKSETLKRIKFPERAVTNLKGEQKVRTHHITLLYLRLSPLMTTCLLQPLAQVLGTWYSWNPNISTPRFENESVQHDEDGDQQVLPRDENDGDDNDNGGGHMRIKY